MLLPLDLLSPVDFSRLLAYSESLWSSGMAPATVQM